MNFIINSAIIEEPPTLKLESLANVAPQSVVAGMNLLLLALALAVFLVSAWLWRRQSKLSPRRPGRKVPAHKARPVTIRRMFIHPIKSCRRVEVTRAEVDQMGFRRDRRFMIWDSEAGAMVSIREKRKLVQIVPILTETHMIVTVPPGTLHPNRRNAPLVVPLEPTPEEIASPSYPIKVWEIYGGAYAPVPEWSQWITEAVNNLHGKHEKNHLNPERYHLLRAREPRHMGTDCRFGEYFGGPSDNSGKLVAGDTEVMFQDGSPYMFMAQPSVDDINFSIEEKARAKGDNEPVVPLTVDRFRPNLVVDGDGLAPWEEDSWYRIRVVSPIAVSGAVKDWNHVASVEGVNHVKVSLTKTRPCHRCVIPTVDPVTGQGHKQYEPLRTLRETRTSEDSRFGDAPLAGVYFKHDDVSTVPKDQFGGSGVWIEVGDVVLVDERNNRPGFLEKDSY